MFTSESVTEGHPDKLCDQISDAIVDHFLRQDPYARVRAECAVSSAIIFIAARFASSAKVDFAHLARKVIRKIGYDQPDFNDKICSILSAPQELQVEKTSRFSDEELTEKKIEKIAAKNQVTLFGFACDHTPVLMPLPIWLSNKLARQLTRVRREKILPYIQPDGKVQVGVAFKDRKPKRIHSVTISTSQNSAAKAGSKKLHQDILENVIDPVFKDEPIQPDKSTRIFINPDGPYLGGPTHHSGLTGRKSAVDTYGEYARHSGDALSGKDPLRIDRVGAYAARYAAKNVVAAGLASECEVMLSYSIGLTQPVSMQVQTFGTAKIPETKIVELLTENFDFRLAGILKQFKLRQLPLKHLDGFYQKLAVYGHFGRTDMDLPWEATDKTNVLAAG
ncbi:MAG: methionine adenosyltransferase [Desulfobacterales bacterium]|jgi:S-adenosylmethionine synthetase